MISKGLLLKPLHGVAAITQGADLAQVTLASLEKSHEWLRESDVLVFAQKIVSKAEGAASTLIALRRRPVRLRSSRKRERTRA
jgi:coenzyme F420-0:L-glutamate ligase/coenzyme F420-1:gamma-L-glutamate ligase